MECPDHNEVSVGCCRTCSREVCEYCLEDIDVPDEFECPDCGEFGVALYDEDYGPLVEEDEPGSRSPFTP